ncbi:MAG: tRNA pseudouridine(55) synthase TruB [Pseudomonadota bacterium]|jgi:tRNA pseudouridine55 synthase|nr:MAG: tRNA pseudouridine(55) synthase TruB [Pseudomonadota bacterium]
MPHGILLLDKPQGLSSNAAVQRVRRAFGRVKAGHTGSLDPLATGMLPICLGEATKVAGFLLEGDKEYEFTARFGQRTSTGDAEGEVVESCEVPQDLAGALAMAIPRYLGTIDQVPPMFSALKRDGQPLYRLARQGIEVEREARRVTIHELTLLGVDWPEARLMVRCSKGTYVRTLAEDLARAMGSCAHLTALRRTAVEPFPPGGLVTLEAVEADAPAVPLLPADAALPQLPAVHLDRERAVRMRHGQRVEGTGGGSGGALVRLYDPAGRFLGIGAFEPDGRVLKPVRLFNNLGPDSA